jgi:hypothetical protein
LAVEFAKNDRGGFRVGDRHPRADRGAGTKGQAFDLSAEQAGWLNAEGFCVICLGVQLGA